VHQNAEHLNVTQVVQLVTTRL